MFFVLVFLDYGRNMMQKSFDHRYRFIELILGDLLRLQKHNAVKGLFGQFKQVSFLSILIKSKNTR